MTDFTEMGLDSSVVLRALVEYAAPHYENPADDPERGRYLLNDGEITDLTRLSANRVLDAAALLERNGYVELHQFLGGNFDLSLTALGRYEYQRLTARGSLNADASVTARDNQLATRPVPVGSPYGFTDADWEFIESERRRSSSLKVVLGYQFESQHYDSEKLKSNIRHAFDEAVGLYNGEPGHPRTSLEFKTLSAGFGEHLFNEITRDIISADIAVFETSEFNPNVMIEMGVALTWGVRVLPVKVEATPEPPSDISGQTWVNYRDSASEFVDLGTVPKIVAMVRRAMQKKWSG